MPCQLPAAWQACWCAHRCHCCPDTHGWSPNDGHMVPKWWVQTHWPQGSFTALTKVCSAAVRAATNQHSHCLSPANTTAKQYQIPAIIWSSFCPKYPSRWFTFSVNIVLGPHLCDQCSCERKHLQFAFTLYKHQTLMILLESINFLSCHHSCLLCFP